MSDGEKSETLIKVFTNKYFNELETHQKVLTEVDVRLSGTVQHLWASLGKCWSTNIVIQNHFSYQYKKT